MLDEASLGLVAGMTVNKDGNTWVKSREAFISRLKLESRGDSLGGHQDPGVERTPKPIASHRSATE
jgi:hypothetical protein